MLWAIKKRIVIRLASKGLKPHIGIFIVHLNYAERQSLTHSKGRVAACFRQSVRINEEAVKQQGQIRRNS